MDLFQALIVLACALACVIIILRYREKQEIRREHRSGLTPPNGYPDLDVYHVAMRTVYDCQKHLSEYDLQFRRFVVEMRVLNQMVTAIVKVLNKGRQHPELTIFEEKDGTDG